MANQPDVLPVRPVEARWESAYRPFLIASLLLGSLVGFVLAIHVPLGRLLDLGRTERTADLIQAHGQTQLLGFAGLYLMGMMLRLLPRFAGARPQLTGLLPAILWPTVVALLLRAVVMPWTSGLAHDALLITSAFGLMLASACYLLVVAAMLSEGRHVDSAALSFLAAGLLLFAAACGGVAASLDALEHGSRSIAYLADAATTQLLLVGFLPVVIAGVGLRALPILSGRERPRRSSALLPGAIALSAAGHGGALLYLEFVAYGRAMAVVSDAALVALGACLLLLLWNAAVLRPAANRARPASRPHLWLVRGAFAWLALAGALAVYFGMDSLAAAEVLSQSEFDALRHTIGAGVVTNLILGMSLLILPEFAVERQQPNRQRLLALTLAALVNAATLLRVAPALAGSDWTADERNLSMAAAGSLAEAALLLFTFVLLRLMWRQRRR